MQLLGILAWIAFVPAAAGAEVVTLEMAYSAALKRSEVVAAQQEILIQAEERFNQAKGSILPTINGTASYLWQEAPTSGIGSSVFPSTQPLVKIAATQPLFRGFREFAGIRQTAATVEAQKWATAQAASQLFRDTAQSFFNVLSIQQELSDLEAELRFYAERRRELLGRIKIGRSRTNEVLSVDAAIANLKAQGEQLRGLLSGAREIFAFLTGLAPDTDLRDAEIYPPDLLPKQSLEEFLARVDSRPELRAEFERRKAAEEAVGVARGAHLPSVDLGANYYLKRSGTLQDVNWDATLALTIPLYAGGVVQSRVREAASGLRQEELAVSRLRRGAEQEIRTLFQAVKADAAQVEALHEATQAAEKSYRQNAADYRLGLVSNIDVLQSLTNFQASRRALDRARYSAKLDLVRLQTAAALRPQAREAAGGK